MDSLAVFIAFCILHLAKSDCEEKRSLYQLWETKLREDLAGREYFWDSPPNGCNYTDVKIHILMKNFDLDSENDIFRMYSWTTLAWTDKRLKWNPSDFGDIDNTIYWGRTYWFPNVVTNNEYDGNDELDFFEPDRTECKLHSDGRVICYAKKIDLVQCTTMLDDWPYDSQQCVLKYGVGKHPDKIHLLPRHGKALSTIVAGYGPEWTIVEVHEKSNVTDETQLKITLIFERNGEVIATSIIFPLIVLATLTTTSILLNLSFNRLLMMLFSIMCHLLYLSQLGFVVPKFTDEKPRVLAFFHNSFVLTVILVFLTAVLIKLRDKVSNPPSWVIVINQKVLESHGRYFIWPCWEAHKVSSNDDSGAEDAKAWNDFANIINSVGIFITIVVYSVMLSLYIPTPIPYS